MRLDRAWSWFEGVRWDHVEWLYAHPEHIDREYPSREEDVALQRSCVSDPLFLPAGPLPCPPPPLEHFQKPWHHERPKAEFDTGHEALRSALGRWFAGFRDRPTPERLHEYLTAPTMDAFPDSHPRSALYNLFNCIEPYEMMEMRFAERLTLHELVRALHHSCATCSPLTRVLERYADPRIQPRYLGVMGAVQTPSPDRASASGRLILPAVRCAG